MAESSKIAWTHSTFNPWIGCSKVHEGCAHCYAEGLAKRTGKAIWGPSGTRSKTSERNWKEPLKWNREAEADGERRRVFCASLADVFEDWCGDVLDHRGIRLCVNDSGEVYAEGIPVELPSGDDWGQRSLTLDYLRKSLFNLIDATPNLDWLLLTKRPENVQRMWTIPANGEEPLSPRYLHRHNVWLGTSISNQKTADQFVPELLKCRELSPVLFLSAEPLLGSIELGHLRRGQDDAFNCLDGLGGPNIDQVIIGVESRGPYLGNLGEFQSEASWLNAAESLVAQCADAGVAAFVKQCPVNGKLSHDPEEWPEALRVRQFPNVQAV